MTMKGCIVKTGIPKHYSSRFGMFGVLHGIKLGKIAQNYRKLTPNLYYQTIEYSGGLKTFPMAMNGYISL